MAAALHYHETYNFWSIYDTANLQFGDQKVAFDGPNKIIWVAAGVTNLDVQADVYSAWKEWNLGSQEAPNPTAYLQAISAIGGDPITDTQNVGITYFLENGWRIQPVPSGDPYVLTVTGNIYTRETGGNPFLFAEGVSVSLTRSNIVDLIRVEALGVNITNTDIAAIADKVWDEALADHTTDGTTGKKLGRIATKIQDIALR